MLNKCEVILKDGPYTDKNKKNHIKNTFKLFGFESRHISSFLEVSQLISTALPLIFYLYNPV